MNFLLKNILSGLHEKFIFLLITWLCEILIQTYYTNGVCASGFIIEWTSQVQLPFLWHGYVHIYVHVYVCIYSGILVGTRVFGIVSSWKTDKDNLGHWNLGRGKEDQKWFVKGKWVVFWENMQRNTGILVYAMERQRCELDSGHFVIRESC